MRVVGRFDGAQTAINVRQCIREYGELFNQEVVRNDALHDIIYSYVIVDVGYLGDSMIVKGIILNYGGEIETELYQDTNDCR